MNNNNTNNKSGNSSKTARNRRRRRRRAKAKQHAKSNQNQSAPQLQPQNNKGRPPNNKKRTITKKKQQQQHRIQHPIQHSQEEQRAARSKLIQTKQVHIRSELDKKEKMLHIMAAADAISHGQKLQEAPKSMQNDIYSPKSMASKQALAAEKRIQQKQVKKAKNTEERKKRTQELLFGDGLKQKDEKIDDDKIQKKENNNKSSMLYKSDKDIPLSSDSKAAEAALSRFGQQKNNKVINASKDRKQRTVQLIHGDLLKDEHEIKVAPRQSTYNDDIDEDIADVHQSILNLNNCNSHETMPGTAKLLKKIIQNLLSAETIYDEEKFGKLRLSNKKIKTAFVEMQYGLETLESLGFSKTKIYNEKEHRMDDYMVFNFMNINVKALLHVIDLLNEYYPEQ